MFLNSVRYEFSQKFAVPVEEAFQWSIDYEPGDIKKMGLEGKRKIKKLTADTIILEDTIDKGKGPETKTRLVRVNHARRSFISTHIGGSTPHSQFWYEFSPEPGGGSRLDFTGLFLLPSKKKLSEAEVAKVAAEERRIDANLWKTFAKAMKADLRS